MKDRESKYGIIALLLVVAFIFGMKLCFGQVRISQQSLWVTTIERDTTWTEQQSVFIGTKVGTDSLCFSIDYVFCFHSLKKANYVVNEIRSFALSTTGDRYFIRMVVGREGFCMWLTNLSGGFPHWYLATKAPSTEVLTERL